MLPQLKKAKVVDAGGLGFYLFFKGMGAAVLDKTNERGQQISPLSTGFPKPWTNPSWPIAPNGCSVRAARTRIFSKSC